MGVQPGELPPSSIQLRAVVVVNHPPLGMMDEAHQGTMTSNLAEDTDFPDALRGYMPDAMRELQRIALEIDNVTLNSRWTLFHSAFKVTPLKQR